ncbi:MAG: hypothetical protein K5762_05630 [Bacilli bacterium]|nr:hypothetical protein [Bacilli bacterium]
MKKFPLLFSILSLLSFSLPGCSNKSSSSQPQYVDQRVALHKARGVSSLFMITSAEQLRSITRYEDALLFVTLPTCTHCQAERGFLSRYIKEHEVVLYEVSYATYKEAYEDISNESGDYQGHFPKVTRTPTYVFYKKGKFKEKFVGRFGSISEDVDNYEVFEDVLEGYTYINNLYMLNDYTTTSESDSLSYHYFETNESVEETSSLDLLGFGTTSLQEQIKKNEDSTILFTWRRCSDCSSLGLEVFDSFLLEHPEKDIYFYEVDGYYSLKRQDDKTLRDLGLNMWANFSKDYHLYNESFYNVDALGNKAGYVPTFVTFNNNQYVSMNVYANESKPVRNHDGTLSFTMAFHEECKALKSKTQVEEKDTTSDTYINALKEIYNQALSIDITKTKAYLEGIL